MSQLRERSLSLSGRDSEADGGLAGPPLLADDSVDTLDVRRADDEGDEDDEAAALLSLLPGSGSRLLIARRYAATMSFARARAVTSHRRKARCATASSSTSDTVQVSTTRFFCCGQLSAVVEPSLPPEETRARGSAGGPLAGETGVVLVATFGGCGSERWWPLLSEFANMRTGKP
jgi:hypothetical protein